MAYAIDTAQAVSDLEASGIGPTQARAIVDTVAAVNDDGITKADFAVFREAAATKADLGGLQSQIDAVKADIAILKAEFAAFKAEFAAFKETAATKADLAVLQSRIDALRHELTLRIVAAQVATATLLFAALKFFE